MGLTLSELAETARAELCGDPGRLIERMSTLQEAAEGSISFLADPRYKGYLATTGASAVILSAADAADCPVDCLVSDNPYLAHARVMAALYPEPRPVGGVHPSACVDPTAEIADSAQISANCFIGAGAVIGADVLIGPGCVVFDNVRIGAGSRLAGMVTLYSYTRLGERCLIHAGVVIGADGFGFANDRGTWVKVPQIGRAVLGDDVEVGSCSSIHCGAIADTVIADGVKIDSQVHIAHNVRIGEHTAIAGCVGIAGSAHVGAHCTFGGQAGVVGHIELADHVHISGATTVTHSVRKPGVYTSAVPAMEHAAWLKNFARLRQLDDMVRRVKALEQELAALRERDDAHE